MKRAVAILVILGCLVFGTTASARRHPAPLKGEGEGLKLIANIPYAGGTDMELITRDGRDYALTGSAPGVGGAEAGAFRIVDVTNPAKPVLISTLECSLYQMDVQVSADEKTAILGQDGGAGPDACLAVGKAGFMTVDITDLEKPKAIGMAEIPAGSHNVTAHPKKPFVYNSSSGDANRAVDVWSIKDPAKPKLINTYTMLGTTPHDISFNKKGTLAVLAGGGKSVEFIDTSDPANPVLAGKTLCAGCSLAHDAKFTPDDSYLIVGDEAAGGGTFPCPGGAMFFYELDIGDVGGMTVVNAIPVGAFEPEEVVFASEGQTAPASCTSHVMDIAPDGKHVAISWYSAGTRYLDISSVTGVTFGPNQLPPGMGVREVGWFIPVGGDSWSSKFHKGPYIYSNDILRGLDIYKITS